MAGVWDVPKHGLPPGHEWCASCGRMKLRGESCISCEVEAEMSRQRAMRLAAEREA